MNLNALLWLVRQQRRYTRFTFDTGPAGIILTMESTTPNGGPWKTTLIREIEWETIEKLLE